MINQPIFAVSEIPKRIFLPMLVQIITFPAKKQGRRGNRQKRICFSPVFSIKRAEACENPPSFRRSFYAGKGAFLPFFR
ncbi:MAG: hypothetical protein IKP72_00760 [Clostridia bacterium]|nr:hypothetical protein [Clostridia bacterium]